MNIECNFGNLAELAPQLAHGICVESASEYCSRFQNTLPNFPAQVISQWFYETPDALQQNAWLDYKNLSFQLEQLSFDVLSNSCFQKNPFVELYCEHLTRGEESIRTDQLLSYMVLNGTWPVPPIILNNINGQLEFPWQVKCDSPYQLLEGHHRFAALYSLEQQAMQQTSHKVWLCRRGVN